MGEIDEMKEYLLNKFPGHDLDEPNIYVGIELERRDNGYISAPGTVYQKNWQGPSGGSSQGC